MEIKQKHINTHSISVGNIMKDMVIKSGGDISYAEQMFALGYVHDIAKELGYWDDHAQVGGNLLKNLGFQYWKEVYYHGQVGVDYSSKELDLLNSADLQVMPNGDIVTAEERLHDIGSRYGFDSQVYKDVNYLATQLGLI